MSVPTCSDEEFVELFETKGPAETSRALGVTQRNVYSRRRTIEGRIGRLLRLPGTKSTGYTEIPSRIPLQIENGTVIVFADAHFWPGIISTSYRALLKAIPLYKPKAIIANGDVFDGASISRHPPIGWEDSPSVEQEIDACKERLGEIESLSNGARLIWPLGNHDARFETRLATVAPQYAKVHGVHLKDHFPDWETCWSCWINDDVVVKHRYKGGTHATHNNAMWAGKTMVTGHLHSQKVTPLTDYNGTRWGVDCGTLAAVKGPQFNDYLEDNPTNWREGFVILTFENGELLQPEMVRVVRQGLVDFRGKLWNVE